MNDIAPAQRRPDSPDRALASHVPGIVWPGIVDENGQKMLSLIYQFDQIQWWPREEIERHQGRQLRILLAHCHRTVPYYREVLENAGYRPDRPLSRDMWHRIALLGRRQIQDAGDGLHSRALPKSHGRTGRTTTSGSTGQPVTMMSTEVGQLFWRAITLRDHLWHRPDFSKKFGVIRSKPKGQAMYPDGVQQKRWGSSISSIFPTGPACMLNVQTPVEQQLEWLQRMQPDYLLTLPSNLLELVRTAAEKGIRLPNLAETSTLGGPVAPELRALVREEWGAPINDMYSSQECGYIALQAPGGHDHYLVQAENIICEVLRENGEPARPGEQGRVVLTPLHNFGMPLIRYDIGDFAVMGDRCPTGRGLPVLERVIGRVRNMMTLPTGEKVSPAFMNSWFLDFPIHQFQVIQKERDRLEINIVPQRPFDAAMEQAVKDKVLEELPQPYRLEVVYRDEIPRAASGKYEDFKSELT